MQRVEANVRLQFGKQEQDAAININFSHPVAGLAQRAGAFAAAGEKRRSRTIRP